LHGGGGWNYCGKGGGSIYFVNLLLSVFAKSGISDEKE